MKCINCGTDNKLKDRTANQGRCIKCNHPFAFEPTTMSNVKITDPFFAKAIADISANNTLFFTPRQLLYLLDNRLRAKSFSGFIWLVPFLIFSFFTAISSYFITPFILSFISFIIFFKSSKSSKLNNKARQANARALQILGGIIIAGGILFSISVNSFAIFVIFISMGMLSIYLGTRQLGRIRLVTQELFFSQSQVKDWLDRWQQING
ncbi:hypothetical protein [Nostoc sp.]|uniref:hypothetical protein n=1 Tax=Nostoc sp. TaxID=1180 RepID=UPI002FF52AF9